MARPNRYGTLIKPNLHIIAGWCRQGATEQEIADKLGISRQALYTYKLNNVELVDTLKTSKDIADTEVEASLYKRAMGYLFEEVKEEYDGKVLVKKTITKKEVVADVTAQIFWLKNRKPKQWTQSEQIEMISKETRDVHIATLEALKNRSEKILEESEE